MLSNLLRSEVGGRHHLGHEGRTGEGDHGGETHPHFGPVSRDQHLVLGLPCGCVLADGEEVGDGDGHGDGRGVGVVLDGDLPKGNQVALPHQVLHGGKGEAVVVVGSW